jgi:hypothetical protein
MVKKYLLPLCLAFSLTNIAEATQISSPSQRLPVSADFMFMRIANNFDGRVRTELTRRTENRGIEFNGVIEASPENIAKSYVYKIGKTAPSLNITAHNLVCFINSAKEDGQTICAEKDQITILFAEKAALLQADLDIIKARMQDSKLQPIIQENRDEYEIVIERIKILHETNQRSYQELKLQIK